MAGRPKKRAETTVGQFLATAFPQETAEALNVLGDNFVKACNVMVSILNDPTERSSERIKAAEYIINRFMGAPRPESSPIDDRLKTAQAVYIEEQILHKLPEVQADELQARAEAKRIETAKWDMQFVTEDQELSNIQDMAASINRALMSMTAEEFEVMAPGVTDPSAALEEFKGVLAIKQAAIVEEVMQYRDRPKEADEDEE